MAKEIALSTNNLVSTNNQALESINLQEKPEQFPALIKTAALADNKETTKIVSTIIATSIVNTLSQTYQERISLYHSEQERFDNLPEHEKRLVGGADFPILKGCNLIDPDNVLESKHLEDIPFLSEGFLLNYQPFAKEVIGKINKLLTGSREEIQEAEDDEEVQEIQERTERNIVKGVSRIVAQHVEQMYLYQFAEKNKEALSQLIDPQGRNRSKLIQ